MGRSAKKYSVKEVFSGDEIALLELIGLFTSRLKYVFYTVAIFFVIGVLIALTSPYEYVAEARILSENGDGGNTDNSLGALQNLFSLGGVKMGQSNSVSGLNANMYPEIINSEPFLLNMMKEEFFFQSKGKKMSIKSYLLEERPGHLFSKMFTFLGGLPGRFFSLFEKKKEWNKPKVTKDEEASSVERKKLSIVNITNQQRAVINQLGPRLQIEAEGRIITLKVKMPEPLISAQLNVIVLEKIIEYVVKYKTEKERDNLRFIEERFEESEQKFIKAQLKLASFRDSNRGITREVAKSREEQLQAEFELTFGIYRGLAQQLEQGKIQLKKDTPLFTEFEPVSVPTAKAEPNIPRIMIIYLILGIIFGFVVIVLRIYYDYKKEFETEE